MSNNRWEQVKFSTKASCFEFLKYDIKFENVDEFLTHLIEQEMRNREIEHDGRKQY